MKRFLSLRSLIILVPLLLLIGVPLATFAKSATGEQHHPLIPSKLTHHASPSTGAATTDITTDAPCTSPTILAGPFNSGDLVSFTASLADVNDPSENTENEPLLVSDTGEVFSQTVLVDSGSQTFSFTATANDTLQGCISGDGADGDELGTVTFTGRIASVTFSVTPKTPFYKLDADVQLFSSNISCPATLALAIGSLKSTVADVCNGTQTAPSDVHVLQPVFDPANPATALTPNSSTSASISLTDQTGQDQKSVNVNVPPAPVWVGVGDSYSSGHNQLKNERHCVINVFTHCDVKENDPAFSWVSRAVTSLNMQLNVPHVWLMTADVEARSGKTTSEIVSQQDSKMKTQLTKHKGSWNVVSLTGGANDLAFSDELAAFYEHNFFNNLEPWSITDVTKCVNTEAIYKKLQQQSASILSNLKQIVADADSSDQNVRIANVDYPYVMNASNVCFPDHNVKQGNKTVFVHGSKTVIDGLDALHSQITGSNIVNVGLRSIFSSSPLGDLQLDALYGYPHPNGTGQQTIGGSAVTDVLTI